MIHVSLVDNPLVLDRSAESFATPEDGANFYVDDASDVDDQYTPTAVGSNRHTGKLPSAPKPNPINLLRTYDLQAGDQLYVDTGDYSLLETITLSATPEVGWGNDVAFRMTGPTDPDKTAALVKANPLQAPETFFILDDAGYVSLEHLTLNNGYRGVWLTGGTAGFVADALTITGSTAEGIRADSESTISAIRNSTVTSSGGHGIYVAGTIGEIADSEVAYSGHSGIYISNSANTRLEANDIYGNQRHGIYVHNYAAETSYVGNVDLDAARGNRVYGNAYEGIYAWGNVVVAGNVVSGHTGSGVSGIYLYSGPKAADNVVYDNYDGITFSGATASENRVYSNSRYGMYVGSNSEARGNHVYSNATGIYSQHSSNVVANNVIYTNSLHGVEGTGEIVNNTIYQPVGDAVSVSGANAQLRNNILWVGAGYAIVVPPSDQTGFNSDYNLVQTTGAGRMGQWQNVSHTSLQSWRDATFLDQHSLSQDPLFCRSERRRRRSWL